MKAIIRSLAMVVGVPTLLAVVYFGLIASDIYVSEARFAIRSSKTNPLGGGLTAMLVAPMISSGGKETFVVADYIKSRDMLDRVQQQLDIRAHFSSSDIDTLSRLDEDASQEEMLEYFKKHVSMMRDSQSGVITLTAKAFDPEVAQKLAALVIDLSEDLVNKMSDRIEEDALQSARDEVEIAAAKVHKASLSVSAFRDNNASLNPAAESSALLRIVSGIETKLIESRAQLGEKMAYMREGSPEIVSLKNRINALSRQLGIEKGRLSSSDEGKGMGDLIEDYQPLMLDQELARQQYASALGSMELARLETLRKKQYLVTFVQPSLPDDAIEPRRFNRILTVMVFSFLVYLLIGLLWSALKDHIGR